MLYLPVGRPACQKSSGSVIFVIRSPAVERSMNSEPQAMILPSSVAAVSVGPGAGRGACSRSYPMAGIPVYDCHEDPGLVLTCPCSRSAPAVFCLIDDADRRMAFYFHAGGRQL